MMTKERYWLWVELQAEIESEASRVQQDYVKIVSDFPDEPSLDGKRGVAHYGEFDEVDNYIRYRDRDDYLSLPVDYLFTDTWQADLRAGLEALAERRKAQLAEKDAGEKERRRKTYLALKAEFEP